MLAEIKKPSQNTGGRRHAFGMGPWLKNPAVVSAAIFAVFMLNRLSALNAAN